MIVINFLFDLVIQNISYFIHIFIEHKKYIRLVTMFPAFFQMTPIWHPRIWIFNENRVIDKEFHRLDNVHKLTQIILKVVPIFFECVYVSLRSIEFIQVIVGNYDVLWISCHINYLQKKKKNVMKIVNSFLLTNSGAFMRNIFRKLYPTRLCCYIKYEVVSFMWITTHF